MRAVGFHTEGPGDGAGSSGVYLYWRQLSKKSFTKFVLANPGANHAAAMPVYGRLDG